MEKNHHQSQSIRLTLKKYPINLSNVSLTYDGKEVYVIHFETVVNLGGAVGIVPITGIVLPFVSYGSSAMISIFVALGIMYSRDYE